MGESDPEGFGGMDLPLDGALPPTSGELELDLPQSGDQEKPAYDPMMGAGRVLGDAFDGFGDDAALPELDLEALAPVPEELPLPPSHAPPAAASAQVRTSHAPPLRPSIRPSSPSLAPAGQGSPDGLSAAEVDATADVGEDPASFVMWVPYAILVLSRRFALKKALEDLRRLEKSAAQDEQEALINLGRALHARREDEALSPLGNLLKAADETGSLAAGRTEEWEKSRQTADAQRSSLQSKIEEAEAAMGPYRDRETKLSTQMDTRAQNLRRAKAQLSRVDIEMRNIRAAESIDAAKLEMVEAQRQARKADVDKTQGHVDELEPQLVAARKELTVMLGAVNDLDKQRRTVDRAQHRTEKVHLSSAGEAEGSYHETVVTIAEEALKRRLSEALEPSLTRSAAMMGKALASRHHEIDVHEAALGAYDRGSFQKGWAIIAVAGLVILTMLVLVAVG